MDNTLKGEMMSESKMIHNDYGWYWAVKDVADYCNTEYKKVMEEFLAIEFLSFLMIIKMKIEYNNLTRKN